VSPVLERGLKVAAAAAIALAGAAATAKEAPLLAADPVLEARVMAISEELRCLVCQNETIAASHADLAVDLRKQVRQQLQQGRSEAQIKNYMVERYGEFVLYRPRWQASTWLLWGGPFVLLGVGAFALARNIRQRRPELADTELSPADAARARQLLGQASAEPPAQPLPPKS